MSSGKCRPFSLGLNVSRVWVRVSWLTSTKYSNLLTIEIYPAAIVYKHVSIHVSSLQKVTTGRIWWYNPLGHTTMENMTMMGKADTFDLVRIARCFMTIPTHSPTIEWVSGTQTIAIYCKKKITVTWGNNYISHTLIISCP